MPRLLDKPVMVLTRASIRLSKLDSFGEKWSSQQKFRGLRWISAVDGVGEWPFIQQATLIWKTQAEMIDYAYKNENIQRVVRLTRKLKWYKEELFARFIPYQFVGQWNGKMLKIFRFLILFFQSYDYGNQ
jgi:hypothetical protein